MHVINAATCQPDDTFGSGDAFHARVFDLTGRLGASVIGATLWEVGAGKTLGPYHFHHGVEEWLYVVSGAPRLRDRGGERTLELGELVAFCSGPGGAHTVHGPGRVVIFSAGDRGWGEAFVSVYPDSDKVAAAPGVMFRRADALDTSISAPGEGPTVPADPGPAAGTSSLAINLMSAPVESRPDFPLGDGSGARGAALGPRLSAQTWAATLYELAPGEATAAYHYKWCREEWALVVSGVATLRHADGERALSAGDICCFPQGPTGAHSLRNDSEEPARLAVFSTSTERPMSAFYPDEGTVLIQLSPRERLLFRAEDRVEDYWEGEPGAA